MAHIKANSYDKLHEIIEEQGPDFMVQALCNYFSASELDELIEFLENELNQF